MNHRTSVLERLNTPAKVCRKMQVLVWSWFLVGVAYGQVTGEPTDGARKATTLQILNSLKQGAYGPATQEEVAKAETGQLESLLEERFVDSQVPDIKAHVAKALVDLGEKNGPYWDFLVQQATVAIESDAPSPRCFTQANCVSGHPAEYVAWARAHNVTEGSQPELALYWLEGKLYGISGDPRGIPMLRQALKSPYLGIVYPAAKGLARAHDKDSIPLIVAACKRLRDPDEVRFIAHTLRGFQPDPETLAAAQAAEEECLPPPDPIEALKRSDMSYVGKAAAAHPAETIAILKENFVHAQDDERQKAQIASTLIELGDKDDIYWDFLLRQGTSALESYPSAALKYSQGTPIEGPAREDAWVTQDALYNMIELFVETVAETRDPRGVLVLQRALSSPDLNIQSLAAAGLTRARDTDSVPLIIDLCKNSSLEMAHSIASLLVYFDDPGAQRAVDQYLSKEDAEFAREEKANGIGPLGPWPPK